MVDHLYEQLTIAAKRGYGNGKLVRYSSGLMKLALALVTRLKKGYANLQQTMQLPSISLLMKKKQAMKTSSGSCPKIYRHRIQPKFFQGRRRYVGSGRNTTGRIGPCFFQL
jgi:hypothetical protein